MDKEVLFLFSENSDICQQELADKTGITQPAICLRLKKLKTKGILKEGHGIDFKSLGLKLTIASGKGDLSLLRESPYFVAGVKSGDNLSVIFCGEDEETAIAIPKAMMKDVSVEPISSFEGNLGFSLRRGGKCGTVCGDCKLYTCGCLGLPGTKWYRGKLWKTLEQ